MFGPSHPEFGPLRASKSLPTLPSIDGGNREEEEAPRNKGKERQKNEKKACRKKKYVCSTGAQIINQLDLSNARRKLLLPRRAARTKGSLVLVKKGNAREDGRRGKTCRKEALLPLFLFPLTLQCKRETRVRGHYRINASCACAHTRVGRVRENPPLTETTPRAFCRLPPVKGVRATLEGGGGT